MSDSNTSSNRAGIGFTGLLTIAFIVLKLCGAIAWPWVWVLAPVWISAALLVVALLVFLVIALVAKR